MRETYSVDDATRLLSYFLNGGRWRRPDAPDDDMPKVAGNPAHRGTDMAEGVDVWRAWWWCIEHDAFSHPDFLWGCVAEDMPQRAVAQVAGVSQQRVSLCVYRDIETFHRALNEGARPSNRFLTERGLAWPSR